jgi:hypothetical protein
MFNQIIRRLTHSQASQRFFGKSNSQPTYTREQLAKFNVYWNGLTLEQKRERAFHPSVPETAAVNMMQGDMHAEQKEFQKALDCYNAASARDENFETIAAEKVTEVEQLMATKLAPR